MNHWKRWIGTVAVTAALFGGNAVNAQEKIRIAGNFSVEHSSSVAIEQFKKGAAWMRAGLPDLRIEIEDMIEEGDQVAVRYVCRGTHLASLLGEAVTSNPVIVTGCTVFRVADGRIAEDWEVLDEAEMMRQIGASPS